MRMSDGNLPTGVVAGALGALAMAHRFFGSDGIHVSRSHSLSPNGNGQQSTEMSEGAVTLAPRFSADNAESRSPWPLKISQYNPFRRQGYELIAENGDGGNSL